MFYPNQWFHRLTPTVHHRIELVVIAVLAFTAGLALSPSVRNGLNFVAHREAAPVAIDTSSPAANVAAPAASAEELQRALELYRQGERALYHTQESDASASVDTELRRAMELYRHDERALSYPGVAGGTRPSE